MLFISCPRLQGRGSAGGEGNWDPLFIGLEASASLTKLTKRGFSPATNRWPAGSTLFSFFYDAQLSVYTVRRGMPPLPRDAALCSLCVRPRGREKSAVVFGHTLEPLHKRERRKVAIHVTFVCGRVPSSQRISMIDYGCSDGRSLQHNANTKQHANTAGHENTNNNTSNYSLYI